LCSFQYPLKLISSSLPTSKCLTVFMLSYGGGLVSNDKINLTATVEDSAKLCLLTQGSTKIFKLKSPEHLTSQTLTCALQPNAALLLLPDPIQPFASSAYQQRQIFELPQDDSASVVMLDWVSEGRSALNEHWDFVSFVSRNEFYIRRVDGSRRLMLRDSVILEQEDGITDVGPSLRERMDGFTVFATLIIRGPKFKGLADSILKRFGDEPRIGGRNFEDKQDFKHDRDKKGGVVWTAASVRGFVLVKISGKVLEDARAFVRGLLLGGSEVVEEFGDGSLLCLQ